MDNKSKLLKILMEINPDINYEQEIFLVDDSLFDSLEIMAIVTEIESCFHIEINPDDIISENFNSLEMMLKLIERNQ